MKILIYGAGVIGSIFAYWLKTGGNDVSILARGKRLNDLKNNGLIIEDALFNKVYETEITVVDGLANDDYYDFILVIMQRQQVSEILPILKKNNSPNIIFAGNNPTGAKEYLKIIDKDRILLGVGGPGGYRDEEKIIGAYVDTPILYVGELDGKISDRINKIEKVFTSSKIKVDILDNIEAWLITHASFISPLAMGSYAARLKNLRLGFDMALLDLTIMAIKENIKALKELGIPILPKKFKMLSWIPKRIIKRLLMKLLNSEFGRIALSGHADHAKSEMKRLSDDFNEIVKNVKTDSSYNKKLYKMSFAEE